MRPGRTARAISECLSAGASLHGLRTFSPRVANYQWQSLRTSASEQVDGDEAAVVIPARRVTCPGAPSPSLNLVCASGIRARITVPSVD
jgi:hypothetical protein